ncbi:hypothetical protein ACJX0J_042129, partial [Zea mays]
RLKLELSRAQSMFIGEGIERKNSEISDELCSQATVERMETYEHEMVRKYGEDYDWRGAPTIDAEVVHSIGGKAHGR